jgi:HAD superfamily hydrolase (TIGR01509 family)
VEWEEFYDKKKQAFMALVHSEEGVALLPGVDELLRSLHKRNVPRCVATNSAQELIDTVRDAKGNEALQLIDNWLTRDHYKKGKPHPECYITAVEKHLSAIKETRRDGRTLNVIGFEDSPRGLRALIDTQRHFARTFNSERINVVAVFVTSMNYPNLDEHLSESIVNGDAPARYVRVSALNDLTDDILKPHMR